MMEVQIETEKSEAEIETEKKFFVDDDTLEKIKKQSDFVSKKEFTDTYFDTSNYSLTLDNQWLRKRVTTAGSKYELKVGLQKTKGLIDNFQEITKEEEIATHLNLSLKERLEEALQKKGFLPFCTFTTTRESYYWNDLKLDFDTTDFGYRIMECEVMVSKKEETLSAEKRIHRFFQEFKIDEKKSVPAKIAVFLSQKNKKHFEELVKANVLHPIEQTYDPKR
jgi:adenylate cyclase class IV